MKKTIILLSSLFLLAGIGLMVACLPFGGIKGSGIVKKENRAVAGFNSVQISGSFSVTITQDTAESLMLEADDNILEHIKTEVKDGSLEIKLAKPIRDAEALNIYLGVKSLKSLQGSGSLDLKSQGALTFKVLDIGLSGSADLDMDVAGEELNATISGSGKLRLKGNVARTSYSVSGSAQIEAFDLKSDNVSVDISGSGDADVYAATSLDVEVSGSGDVRYKGSPPKIRQSISGSGSLEKVE